MGGESYFGNVICLFRPSKQSKILKTFFLSPLQSEILFFNIPDVLLLFFYSHTTFRIHMKVNSETSLTPKRLIFTTKNTYY